MKIKDILKLTTVCVIQTLSPAAYSQTTNAPTMVAGIPVNYDESKVGDYTLPDPLTLTNGRKVKDQASWIKQRRPEILRIYEAIQFGKVPGKPAELSFKVFDKGTPVFGGKAIRRQVTVYFTKDTSDHKMDLLIYLPVKAAKPAPMLLTVSFMANSAAVNDPGVKPGMIWRGDKKVLAGASPMRKVDVEKFIDRGIGYATVYYGDIEPDFKQGIKYGIRGLYLKPGAVYTADDEWGAISAWSWGLSRAMDYFEIDKDIDAKRVAITGASRLGKTALWTGARDERFALVIASISGEGGAALSRRNFGETIKHITDTSRYFYQFAPNYHKYSDRVSQLPMDSHMLISLVAPRPLLLQTGDSDNWSDPKGEFLAALAAQPVYQLFRKQGLNKTQLPQVKDTSMQNTLGYYMHSGGHAVLPDDYDVFISFIIKHFAMDKVK
jgi:hypothetical protein